MAGLVSKTHFQERREVRKNGDDGRSGDGLKVYSSTGDGSSLGKVETRGDCFAESSCDG